MVCLHKQVGLVDVKYVDDDGISIASAVIKYLDRSKGELTKKALNGEIVSRYTNARYYFPVGHVWDIERKQFTIRLDKKQQRPAVFLKNALAAWVDTGAFIPVWTDMEGTMGHKKTDGGNNGT